MAVLTKLWGAVIEGGRDDMKPAEKYPDLVELSCKNCRLDCNGCQFCDYGVEEFLRCDLVPEGCVLRHNILVRLKSCWEEER